MIFPPLDKKERLEWQGMLMPADSPRLLAATVLFTLSLLAIPFAYVEAVAGLYLVYAAVFYYMLTRAISSIVAMAVPGMILYAISVFAPALPHPYLMPAVYAAVMMGSVSGAFLLLHCRAKKFLPLCLIPVAVYAAAAAVAGPFQALWVLVPVVLAPVLAHGIWNCRAQTPVLITLAALLALAGVVSFLVFYGLHGWPQLNPFREITALVQRGVDAFFRTLAAAYETQGLDVGMVIGDTSWVCAAICNVLPGIFLAGCAIFAFGMYRTFLRVLVCWGTLPKVPARVGALTASPLSAGLYLGSYLLSLLAGEGIFGAVCENLSLVLEPAFVLIGVMSLLVHKPGRSPRFSFLFLILSIGLVVNFPTLALSLAALLGAVRVLLARFFGGGEGEKK